MDSPYITEDRVYVPSAAGGVYGFTHSGKLDWRVERDHFSPPTPIVTNKWVFAGGSQISAMNISEENIAWEVSGVYRGAGSFTADSNAVYYSTRIDGRSGLACVDSESGDRIWEVKYGFAGAGLDIRSLQQVENEILFRDQTDLVAVNKTNGDEIWRKSFDGRFNYSVIGKPQSDKAQLFVREEDPGGRRDTIYAFEYPSRERHWSYARDFERLAGPSFSDDFAFLTGTNNEITKLDRTDGSVIGRVKLDRRLGITGARFAHSTPAVTNDMVIVSVTSASRNYIVGIQQDSF